jgi:hypothetical protein
VRFICNAFGINTDILGNEPPYFIGIESHLRRRSRVHRFPPDFS